MNARRQENSKTPSTRREVLESVNACESTHAGLWLERFSRNLEAEGNNAETIEKVTNTVKVSAEYAAHFERWKKFVEENTAMVCDEANVHGRMVVGLGAESVLETAITLHRTYGVPYIPGSALKGLARSAAQRLFVGEDWKKDGAAHKIMFGTTDEAGYVTFHDALLVAEKGDSIPLDLDVMTVHHAKYYGGGPEAPADWDSPNPVAFVTARGTYLIVLEGPREWTEKALAILAEALWEEGIGAKTAAGYGRMKLRRKEEQEKAALEAKQRAEALQMAEEARIEAERKANEARVANEKRARENAFVEAENLKKNIGPNNAKHLIETVFAKLPEDVQRRVAKDLVAKLKRKWLDDRKDQAWVQMLYAAEQKG